MSTQDQETPDDKGILEVFDRFVGENLVGIWARSEAGGLVYANAALQRMLGAKEGKLPELFRHWRDQVHPQDRTLFDQGERALRQKGHREIHYRLAVPGRPTRWVEDRASVTRQGTAPGNTIGFLADITERKDRERQITALSRFLGVFSQTSQAIIRCSDAAGLYCELCDVLTRYGGFAAAWVSGPDGGDKGAGLRIDAHSGIHGNALRGLGATGNKGDAEAREYLAYLRLGKTPHPRIFHIDGSLPFLEAHFPAGGETVVHPLRLDGEVVAALTLVTRPDETIDEDVQAMLYGVTVDISFALGSYARETRRRQAEEKLRLAAKVFESSREGIIITDPAQRILSVNRTFTEVTGYGPEEVLGRTPSVLSSGRQDREFYRRMWRTLKEKGYWQGEIWNRRRNGEVYPELLGMSAVTDEDGRVSHYIGVFSDITERKQDQQKLAFLAHHDALTGLPNRVLLRDRVEMAISNRRRTGCGIALAFLDLDNFKAVNDTLGHQFGDRMLVALVARIRECLRETDTLSRLAGDEFVAVVNDVRGSEDAAVVARKILASLETPLQVDGQSVTIALSIGIALHPEDGADFDQLLRNADTAMYHAKKAGKRTFRFFEDQMNAGALERLQLQSSLFQAVIREELALAYQPQMDIASGRIVGAEALLRWNSPVHGPVPPSRFIPIAEESGCILSLGDWVLEQVCRQARAWRDAGLPGLVLAVNLSGLQLRRGNLATRIGELLSTNGLPPESLELEITESTMIQDEPQVLETIDALKALGVKLAIDDFGTGFSNLGSLRRFKADRLKVDRSFVEAMDQGPDGEVLVRTILQMARNLGLATIAEGVETEAQLARLAAMECDGIQGFLFSRPLPPAALAQRLAEPVQQHP